MVRAQRLEADWLHCSELAHRWTVHSAGNVRTCLERADHDSDTQQMANTEVEDEDLYYGTSSVPVQPGSGL